MALEILKGLRVLDVSNYGAVPFAGAVLADWGAEVIKVEDAQTPDPMRRSNSWGVGTPDGGSHPLYHVFNRGKRHAAINLKCDKGREAFFKLVATSDVMLTSFMPGVRRRLKIDVEDVRVHRPDIIYASNSGRGVRGPTAELGGFDSTSYWARSGVAMATSEPDQAVPTGMPAQAFGDSQTGFALASGVIAALLQRERTGRSAVIDTSLLATGMWAMQAAISLGVLEGREIRRPPPGVAAPLNNLYRTKDGRFFHISLVQQRYWPSFCDAVGRPEWKEDPMMRSQESRDANAAHAAALVQELFAERTYEEWNEILPRQTGPYDPVQNARELADDPQVIANGYLAEVRDELGRNIKVVSPPVKFDGVPYETKPAPAHGVDTDDLLVEAGYTMDEVIQLKIDGAIF